MPHATNPSSQTQTSRKNRKSFDFKPESAYYIQWIAYCGMLAGAAFGSHKLTGEKHKGIFITMIWTAWAGLCAVLLVARNNPESAQTTEVKSAVWQPPEIPKGTKVVTVFFGGQRMDYPFPLLSQYPYGPTPEWFPISAATPEEKRIMEAMPGFSRNTKQFLGRLVTSNFVNGLPENYPIIPVISSNRLFVYVKIPFLAERQKIVMSDAMDAVLTNCLPITTNAWDWNFSRGKEMGTFEIVNGHKNPIVQVIYKSASMVQVYGIFFRNKYDFSVTYDGRSPGWFFGSSAPIQIVENQQTQTVTVAELQTRFTNASLSFDAAAIYDEVSTNQRAIFKYPSNLYPGEFAEKNLPIESFGSCVALRVACGIVGFGVVWMFFGWIIFQKRPD